MNRVEINNLCIEDIEELDTVQRVLLYALEKEGFHDTCFSIILVDEEYVQRINKMYRNIDRVTDVITFALDDEKEVLNASEVHVLGDIYICLSKARSQAKCYGHSFLREISFLAVHGFYHLLGYDHMTKEEEEVMFKKQEEVLEENGITR